MLNYTNAIIEEKSYSGLQMKEFKPVMKLIIRGKKREFLSAIGKSLNLLLPTEANTSSKSEKLSALWLSPDEWIIHSNEISNPDNNNYEIENLLNKNISIGGTSFEVIGILKKKGSGGWNGPDERVFIPLLTASERVMGHERLQSIRVSVPDEVTISEAMIEIERVIRSEHDIGPGDDNDFRIIDWSEIREMQQETFAILTTMITGIASISLLVGGIGVMNIMLVSVTERTREIGLRKALGATPKTILVQFLIEAMMLCIIGGVMGVLIGSLIVISVAISQDWAFYIPISAIIGSITFSAFVGLLFGVWPARRAASLDPAVALQYE